MSDASEKAITIVELAEMLNISTDKAYLMANAGEIPAFKVGRVWRMFPSEVKAKLDIPVDPWQRPSHSRARRRAA